MGKKTMSRACTCLFISFKFTCTSLKYLANANAVAAFANSDGCIVKFPMAYQQRCPAITFPATNNPANDINEMTNSIIENFSKSRN